MEDNECKKTSTRCSSSERSRNPKPSKPEHELELHDFFCLDLFFLAPYTVVPGFEPSSDQSAESHYDL